MIFGMLYAFHETFELDTTDGTRFGNQILFVVCLKRVILIGPYKNLHTSGTIDPESTRSAARGRIRTLKIIS